MPLIARASGGDFTPCPEGQFAAICVDAVDLGMMTSHYDKKERTVQKCRLAFLTEDVDPVTKKMYYVGQMFTLSLSDKANLRKFLESWRGKKFTAEELEGFDVEKLIGAGAFIQVVQVQREAATYANIETIMKLPKGMKAPKYTAADYVRVKDRPKDAPAGKPPAGHADEPMPDFAEDDDTSLPF